MRTWNVIIKPEAFHLETGADALSDYQFGGRVGHHLFCQHCGVRSFESGHLDVLGGDYYSVSVSCLDDVTVDELLAGPIKFADGRNNAWWQPPPDTRHL